MTYQEQNPHPYFFGMTVEAREAHGGMGRRVRPGERGVVVGWDNEGARYTVRWANGRTTTAYPWHLAAVHDVGRYTAAVVVLHIPENGETQVLLAHRASECAPYPTGWVLPGGPVGPTETARQAAVRALAELTGIHVAADDLVEFGVFDEPDRVPHSRDVSVAYVALADHTVAPTSVDESLPATWVSMAFLPELALDHAIILDNVVSRTTGAQAGPDQRGQLAAAIYESVRRQDSNPFTYPWAELPDHRREAWLGLADAAASVWRDQTDIAAKDSLRSAHVVAGEAHG
jgi:8-oxo-dGTP diphosphatase